MIKSHDEFLTSLSVTDYVVDVETGVDRQYAGETASFGGQLRGPDGPAADVTFSIEITDEDGSIVDTVNATTDDDGFFTAQWRTPNTEGEYGISGETAGGDVVAFTEFLGANRLELTERSDGAGGGGSDVTLQTDVERNGLDFTKPGEQVNLTAEATEDGEPIPNETVEATLSYNYPEISLETTTVETDASGQATLTLNVPDAAVDGAGVSADVTLERDGETHTNTAYLGEVQRYDVDFEGAEYDTELTPGERNDLEVSVRDADGDPVADVPFAVAAQYDDRFEVFDTDGVETGSDGDATVTVDVPADAEDEVWLNSIHRYSPVNHFDTASLAHPLASVTPTTETAAPGETVTVDFETDDGDARGLARLSSYTTETVRYGIGTESDGIEVPIPAHAEDGTDFRVSVQAYGSDGSYYVGETAYDEVIEVDGEVTVTPSLAVEPRSVETGETVTLDASESSAVDGIDSYEWAFGDGTTEESDDSVVEHVYDEPGEYEVELTVIGTDGTERSTTGEVTVESADGGDPTNVTLESTPETVERGENVTIDATANRSVTSYEWDLSGNATVNRTTDQSTIVVDTDGWSPGQHTLTVTVSTEDGQTATGTTSLTVEEPSSDGLTVDNVRAPSTVATGEEVAVSTTVVSENSTVRNESVALAVDTDGNGALEDVVDTRTVSLDAGETTTVGLDAVASLDPGTYAYQVATGNDGAVGEFEVVSHDFETAVSTGDPHLVTFDGTGYDFQAAGEFVLVRETNGSFEVQARQEPSEFSDSVTVNTAVATTVDGREVVVDATRSTPVTVNGTVKALDESDPLEVGNGTIERSGGSYTVTYPGADDEAGPGDEHLTLDRYGDRLDVEVSLHADRERAIEGPLGDLDGNSSDDLTLANGSVLSESPDSTVLYGAFREDWRVSAESSLFTYENDSGPDTYYDPNVPRNIFSVEDLDQDVRSEAEEVATNAGLEPGTNAFRSAVIDYAITGDESYVASAKDQNASADVNETVSPDVPAELDGEHELVVTAENGSGDLVVDAEVALYNESYDAVDSRWTNDTGAVSWSTLKAGEYNVELYGPNGAFWGSQDVSVDDGGASMTVGRQGPRLADIALSGDEDGSGVYEQDATVSVRPAVRNDGPERPVRTRITLESSSVTETVVRGDEDSLIASGDRRTFEYEYTPSSGGERQVSIVTETRHGGRWVATDVERSVTTFKLESEIVGYDPETGEFANGTTSDAAAWFQSAEATLPHGADESSVTMPSDDYEKRSDTATDNYPWSAVGQLAYDYLGGCSATVVEDSHVLTAGHCVYEDGTWLTEEDPNGNAIEEVQFLPGRDHDSSPFGQANVTFVQTYEKWVDGEDRSYDLAVLTLDRPVGQETGTFGYESHALTDPVYDSDGLHVTGYPSIDAPFVDTRGEQWDFVAEGQGTDLNFFQPGCWLNDRCHRFATGSTLDELIYPGNSGGPVWEVEDGHADVVSVVSAGPAGAGKELVDPVSDITATRLSADASRDVGRMIGNGYEQVDADDPNPSLETPAEPPRDTAGAATGDPHLTTYDGVAYDFQAAGEFVLTETDEGGEPSIQARLRPVADREVSVISAVATALDGRNVTIDARDEDTLTVDGNAESLSSGESLSVGGGEISRIQDRYVVVYPGADDAAGDGDSRLEVSVQDDRLDVFVKPNRSAVDSMSGLLGSPDGDASNDLARADGSTLPTPPAFEELYGEFRDDHRVTEGTSLFDYDDSMGPDDYYDADFPAERVTVDDLDEDDRAAAVEVAQNAGLEPGTAAFEDAVLDYALTGEDSYVASAALAAEEVDVETDASPSETNLSEPGLTVDANQNVTNGQPLEATLAASHAEPGDVTVVVSNATDVVYETNRSDAFDAEATVTWNGTADGADVADGDYSLAVVASSEAGVTTVRRQAVVIDRKPPTVTVNANGDAVIFNYSDAGSGVDHDSLSITAGDAVVTEDAVVSRTGASYDIEDLSPGESRDVELSITDGLGNEARETVTVAAGEADDGDGGSGRDSGGGGGGGGAGGGGGGGGGGGTDVSDGSTEDTSPAVMSVDASVENESVAVDENVTLTVRVSNDGGERGTFDASIRVGDQGNESVEIAVPSNETVMETITVSFDSAGERTIEVGEQVSQTITVTEEDPGTSDDSATEQDTTPGPGTDTSTRGRAAADVGDDPTTTTGNGPGFGVVVALCALLALGLRSRD
ncbi:VWD domain-containing protein [Halorientalis halophila]|uniref:VWD domain-containing protein n=1 Tax=Halorientalis halophila TaxID=3108499 RepID=UPI00300A4045